MGKNRYGFLQLFAGPKAKVEDDLDDLLDEEDGLDTEDDEEELEGDDEPGGDDEPKGDEAEQEGEGKSGKRPKAKGAEEEPGEEKMIPRSKVQSIIQDRIGRMERKHQKALEEVQIELKSTKDKLLNELKSYAGVDFDENTVREALRFYAFLQVNPEHSRAWNNFLAANPWRNQPKFEAKASAKAEDVEARLEAKIELRDTLRDLRQDPLFKKYEQRVMDYAEDEGFDVATAKGLKQAWKAWRGENTRLIAANARTQGMRDAKNSKDKANGARLERVSGGRGPSKGTDYSKLSDSEVLKKLNVSLFTPD